jgi:peptidoglycan/xylan/chitin deacetylase (PgdA/CDA1 family)
MNVSLAANFMKAAGLVGSGRNRLTILIYHQVLAQPDPMRPAEVDAAAFDWQMQLVSSGLRVLPLAEAVERLERNDLPARAACITFDDGYADNLTIATPILKRHGLTATFFIATGFLDGGRMWNDSIIESVRAAPGPTLDLTSSGLGCHSVASPAERMQAAYSVIRAIKHRQPAERADCVASVAGHIGAVLPDNLMMTSAMVRQLRNAGMSIGGHTVSHPILASTDVAAARREIMQGKEQLEAIIGEPVKLFAYPNGKPGADYRAEHVRIVRDCGFRAAVSTSWGTANHASDPFQLPRFLPWDKSPGMFAARLLKNRFTRPTCAA